MFPKFTRELSLGLFDLRTFRTLLLAHYGGEPFLRPRHCFADGAPLYLNCRCLRRFHRAFCRCRGLFSQATYLEIFRLDFLPQDLVLLLGEPRKRRRDFFCGFALVDAVGLGKGLPQATIRFGFLCCQIRLVFFLSLSNEVLGLRKVGVYKG